MPMSIKRNELFSENPMTGQRVDSHIHEPILAGIEKKLEAKFRQQSMAHAQELGLPPEIIARLFGENAKS